MDGHGWTQRGDEVGMGQTSSGWGAGWRGEELELRIGAKSG
jgi:hypothetical protein